MACNCGGKKRRRRRELQAAIDRLKGERAAATASGDMDGYRRCTEDMIALLSKGNVVRTEDMVAALAKETA